MRRLILSVFFLAVYTYTARAQLYTAKSGNSFISFFSSSPLEDIKAVNTKSAFILNTTTNEIQVGVTMVYFKFPKPLMEEHFNENYVESDKYPTSVFKGKILESVDYTKDGENPVTVKGNLSLHGVSRDVEMKGTLTKKGNSIVIASDFKIRVADYDIKIPSLYVRNIAEVVDVSVAATLHPFVK